MDALLKDYGLAATCAYRYVFKGFAASMSADTVTRLQRDGRIALVEADGPVALCDANPMMPKQAGLLRIGGHRFPVAHINGVQEPLDVGVAVLDTGIFPHPDLNVYQSYSTIPATNYAGKLDHGTKVAGILAAVDNGLGIVGVAPGVRLWDVKCSGSAPYNVFSYVIAGMDYVAQHSNEIAVVSMSIINGGTAAPVESIRTAVRALVGRGIVVVACAGNSGLALAGRDEIWGTGDDCLPASLPDTMAVGGMNPTNDSYYVRSNFGDPTIPRNGTGPYTTNYVKSPGGTIDVVAPAEYILSTSTNSGYATDSGTSFAAPHVSGIVALYIAVNGRATNAQGVYAIRQSIVDSSVPNAQWLKVPVTYPRDPEPLAVPSESWVPAPRIASITSGPAGPEVGFLAVPGYDYTVQATNSLQPALQWGDVRTVAGFGHTVATNVADTARDINFYRLLRRASE